MKKPSDDRGLPCDIAKLSMRQICWRALGLKSIAKDPIVKKEMAATAVPETSVALIGGVVGWVLWDVFVGSMTKPLVGTSIDLLLQVVFAINVAMCFWFILLNHVRTWRFSQIAEIFLTEGLCAACGYNLKDLATDTDGCIVCPECHGAWKNSRIGNQSGNE